MNEKARSVGIFGPDSGRFAQGIVDLSGNGFPGSDLVTWQFTAPPYGITDFDHDITGPDHADVPGVRRDRPGSWRWQQVDAVGCGIRGVLQLHAPS